MLLLKETYSRFLDPYSATFSLFALVFELKNRNKTQMNMNLKIKKSRNYLLSINTVPARFSTHYYRLYQSFLLGAPRNILSRLWRFENREEVFSRATTVQSNDPIVIDTHLESDSVGCIVSDCTKDTL